MNNAKVTIGLIAGCILLSADCLRAQDWPQWRGPNRDAKVTGFTAPKTWPKELTQKWKVTVGDGVATPALVGDKLYVFSRQGGKEILRCLEAATDKELWKDDYETGAAQGPASSFPGPRSSPAVADGKVVTLGVRGILSCYEADSGKQVWRKDDFKGSQPMFFTSSSPVIVDGLCVVQLGGERKGGIVAYNLATGDEKWKWTDDGTAYASPVLLTVDGTNMLVAETSGHIVGLGVADGKFLWKTPFKVRYNACTPIVDGQTIIYSGVGGGTHAVKIEKDGEAFAAKEFWSNPEISVIYNTPVVKNGLIFGLAANDNFFCLNAQTGKTAWSTPKGPKSGAAPPAAGGGGGAGKGRGGRGRGGMGGGAGYGSIVDAGSVLLALTPSMELIVFEPSDKEFKPLVKYKVAATATYAYPVISGNRVFIKDKDSLTLWTIE